MDKNINLLKCEVYILKSIHLVLKRDLRGPWLSWMVVVCQRVIMSFLHYYYTSPQTSLS